MSSTPKKPSLADRSQATFSGWMEQLRRWLIHTRAKDFILLALPYQISAVLTALVAVGYTWTFNWLGHRNADLLGHDPRWIFLTAPIGFLLSWWLVFRFAPMAGGSGIPQLMAAVEVATDKKRDRSGRFLNLRILLVKILSSMTMIAGGGAIGREGPTLQIAGSIYRTVHRLLPPFWPKVSRRIMMITGGAAGLSAAFNTPLGGIVFAVEELTKTHMAQFRTAVLTAVILSGMTAQWLLGPYLMLGYPTLAPASMSFMYKILLLSAIAGVAGALFCRGLFILDKLRRTMSGQWFHAGFALACAFLFATMAYMFGNVATGSGHAVLQDQLFADAPDSSGSNVFARLLGSLLSASAGGAGGIFAPALASGAAIGGWLADTLGLADSRGQYNLLVLAGMAAFLTGVTRSPFTSAILVLEMTDRHSAIFQLMYASIVGYLIAYVVDRKSFYERMKERLLKAMPDEEVGVAGSPPGPQE
ncbi:MAG: chloride channel protein [Flavobacteriales bacterium]|nr:chloride channel protein [Flavobacteriales bacterium]